MYCINVCNDGLLIRMTQAQEQARAALQLV